MRTKQVLSIFAVALVAAAALAVQDGFTVKRQAKEGQTIKYKLEGDVDFQGTPVGLTASVTERVTKVDGTSGNYTLEQAQTGGSVDLGGNPQPIPDSTSTTTYKPDGELVEIKGEGSDLANVYRMANLGLLIDPGKMVKTGDKWTFDIKADAKTGAVAAKADYEVIATEKIGNYDTVKIKAHIKEAGDTDPAEADGFVWLDQKDGSMVKSESDWKNAPFPGAPGPMNAKIKLNRVD